jgi:hypothetical protein
MPYTLVKGEFHIHYPDMPRNGPEPDGDTLKFKPDDPQIVRGQLPNGGAADFNGRGMVNLRFEGIDALETHFSEMHQDMTWANAARDRMLRLAKFQTVQFFPDLPEKVSHADPHPTRGYVLSNGLDGHGRIVSFVYADAAGEADGSAVWLDAGRLNQSLNAKLMSDGLVYPMYYTSLPRDLRDRLTELVIRAWNYDRGLWPADVSYELTTIGNLADLEALAMWPKLFRRLAKYFASGYSGLGDFEAWLRADPRDRDDRLQLPDGELGNMHDVIELSGNRIRMRYWPEELVVLPDDA